MDSNHGPPHPLPNASAPIESDFPTPPPSYSECEPSYPQKQQQPFLPQQQRQQTFPQNQFITQQPQIQHVIVSGQPISSRPINTSCPSCHATIVTRVRSEPNISTHLIALLLCVMFPCCSCIPYCVESCQSTVHSCPSCGAYVYGDRPAYR